MAKKKQKKQDPYSEVSEAFKLLRKALISSGRLDPGADRKATVRASGRLMDEIINHLGAMPPRPDNMSAEEFLHEFTGNMLELWTDEVLKNNRDPLRKASVH